MVQNTRHGKILLGRIPGYPLALTDKFLNQKGGVLKKQFVKAFSKHDCHSFPVETSLSRLKIELNTISISVSSLKVTNIIKSNQIKG